VSFSPAASHVHVFVEGEVAMGRSIGLNVHRDICEVAIAEGGRAH